MRFIMNTASKHVKSTSVNQPFDYINKSTLFGQNVDDFERLFVLLFQLLLLLFVLFVCLFILVFRDLFLCFQRELLFLSLLLLLLGWLIGRGFFYLFCFI